MQQAARKPAPYEGFVHLRARSAFSLAEGALLVKDLVGCAKTHRMPAVAITDNNNLFGAIEFSEAAAKSGIQPIIGVQLDVDVGGATKGMCDRDRLLLLCQSEAGYGAMCRLVTKAHLDSTVGVPCVALDEVIKDSEGLICLWGGSDSALVRLIRHKEGSDELALLLKRYAQAFSGRLYLELQRCGEAWEADAERAIVSIAYEHQLPLVATNDVYFANRDAHEAHDILLCIGQGNLEAEPGRRRVTAEHYFKSSQEMRKLFRDLPEAIENTVEIAMRCSYMVRKRAPMLPTFPLPEGVTAESALRTEALRGFEERFETVRARLGAAAEAQKETYLKRLEYELSVIVRMEFSGYFLIVSDFMKWAKAQRIPVGVRGSGATSIVAWSLYITHLDPLRFNLVFERFLNPERITLPDFDVDFCQERRAEVIEYVRGKYGADRVAQIITFGTLQAKAAVKDVGRVIGAPYSLVDKLSRLIGNAATLKEALDAEPQLNALLKADELAHRCVSIAQKLEGMYRHASTHAAGVVISDRPLVELVPLYKDHNSEMPVTQFHFKDVEKAGLVKFDFLGLRTLTIIATAVDLIKQSQQKQIDIGELDFDDPKVYEYLRTGEVTGVFQLESAGMRDLLRKLRPDRIEHLIALISLYRPGPMDSIPAFIARANGREPVRYDHPLLAPVLSETYGIITYQEDVMQIARSLAGYSLGEADLLRRAMGKKIKAEMDEHSARFTSGAVERGVPADIAAAIFDQCAKFAGYGFNKGHAAAYAQISYQTAFLRCYYPIEFYAACMTVDYNRIDRLATYHRELKEAGMTVLPPDVNASQAMFSIEEGPQGRAIRYGLAALKGVGTSVAQRIVDERRSRGPFTDALNFFSRCADIVGSRSVAEQLVKAGALDRLNASRGALLANVVDMMRLGSAIHRDRVSQQERLFGDAEEPVVFKAKEPAGRTRLDDLRNEVSSIGFYMSGHPLDDLMPFLKGRVVPIKEALSPRGSSRSLAIAGVVQAVRVRRSQKSGNRYAFVNVSDPSGEVDLLVFSEALEKANGLLEVGAHVMARVSAEVVDGDVRLSAFAIEDLSGAMRAIDTIEIALDNVAGNEFDGRLNALESELAMRSNGRCRILLRLALTEQPGHVVIKLPGTFDIDAKFMLDAPSKWGPCLPVSSGAPLS